MATVQVTFRLVAMECCEFNSLSIDTDVPHYCPRCGTGYAPDALPAVLIEDFQAALIYTP